MAFMITKTRRDMAKITTRAGVAAMTQEKFDPKLLMLMKDSGKSFVEIFIGFELVRMMTEGTGGIVLGEGGAPSRTELLKRMFSEMVSWTGNDSVRRTDVSNIFDALSAYGMDNNGLYPEGIYDGSLDDYLPGGVPVDPVTGKSYSYIVSEDHQSFKVYAPLENGKSACASFIFTDSPIPPCED